MRLLDDIHCGVDSKAEEARHVEDLHDAVPAVASEPLIVPRHVPASCHDVWLIPLHSSPALLAAARVED